MIKVSIHGHSMMSLLDGIGTPEEYLKATRESNLPGFACTDHSDKKGGTTSWYCFNKAFKDTEINFLPGTESYFSPDRFVKNKDALLGHLLLLAQNQTGLRNINKLVTRAYSEGFYNRPRVDWQLLEQFNEGVIATSGCASSPVGQYLRNDEYALARDWLVKMQDIFEDRFYLELQPHPFDLQDKINEFLINFSDPVHGNVPYVTATDSHYPFEQDSSYHDISVCIATKKKYVDEQRMQYDFAHHVRGFEDQHKEFSARGIKDAHIEAAIENTDSLLRTSVELPEGLSLMPGWDNAEEEFKASINQGIQQKLPHLTKSEWKVYSQRLREEHDLIAKKGFAEYFLMVADMVEGVKSRGVYCGPGRGSGSGSLVAYLTGITEVDPIRWDTSFERFLPEHRNDLPDIDLDFSSRSAVFDYLKERYGDNHVAYVSNYVELSGLSTINDVARVYETTIPKYIKDGISASKGVEKYYKSDRQKHSDEIEKNLDVAARLEGNVRHVSKHAGGIIVSKVPIDDYSAQYIDDGDPVSVYNKDDLETIGFVKLDALGLSNITVINKCLSLIEERGGTPPENIWNIPVEGEMADRLFEEFSKGNTDLIFQFGGGATKQVTKRMKPDSFEDLIAASALSRPGPTNSGATDSYIKRKHGDEDIAYPHSSTKDYLEKTKGLIIFQEDFMAVCRNLAGMEWPDVHKVRKMSGKKDSSEVEYLRKSFVNGILSNTNLLEEDATALFNKIAEFAEYGFSYNHAVAYTLTSWATMYLQVYHPFEWYLANLQVEENDADTSIILREASKTGIDISYVDINFSDLFWSYSEDTLVPGLTFISGVGAKAAQKIVDNKPYTGGEAYEVQKTKNTTETRYRLLKEDGSFTINKNTYESLAKAGAIPGLEADPIEKAVASGLPVNVVKNKEVNSLWNAKPLSKMGTRPCVVHGYVKSCRKAAKGDYALTIQGDINEVLYHQDKVEEGPYLFVVDGSSFKHAYGVIPSEKWSDHPLNRNFGMCPVFEKSKEGAAYLFKPKKAKKNYVALALTPKPKTVWLDQEYPEGFYYLSHNGNWMLEDLKEKYKKINGKV